MSDTAPCIQLPSVVQHPSAGRPPSSPGFTALAQHKAIPAPIQQLQSKMAVTKDAKTNQILQPKQADSLLDSGIAPMYAQMPDASNHLLPAGLEGQAASSIQHSYCLPVLELQLPASLLHFDHKWAAEVSTLGSASLLLQPPDGHTNRMHCDLQYQSK